MSASIRCTTRPSASQGRPSGHWAGSTFVKMVGTIEIEPVFCSDRPTRIVLRAEMPDQVPQIPGLSRDPRRQGDLFGGFGFGFGFASDRGSCRGRGERQPGRAGPSPCPRRWPSGALSALPRPSFGRRARHHSPARTDQYAAIFCLKGAFGMVGGFRPQADREIVESGLAKPIWTVRPDYVGSANSSEPGRTAAKRWDSRDAVRACSRLLVGIRTASGPQDCLLRSVLGVWAGHRTAPRNSRS
jgi:hypothetical protein